MLSHLLDLIGVEIPELDLTIDPSEEDPTAFAIKGAAEDRLRVALHGFGGDLRTPGRPSAEVSTTGSRRDIPDSYGVVPRGRCHEVGSRTEANAADAVGGDFRNFMIAVRVGIWGWTLGRQTETLRSVTATEHRHFELTENKIESQL